jgi:hypothetical protein
MAKDDGWGRRLRSARRAFVERHDAALTYEAIGEALGRLLKRPAFKHSTVRAWFADGQEPESFEVARAIATVLEADAGYLITGVASQPEATDRPLPTNEELAAMTGATVGKPRELSIRDLEREAATKHAAKKGGGRRRA